MDKDLSRDEKNVEEILCRHFNDPVDVVCPYCEAMAELVALIEQARAEVEKQGLSGYFRNDGQLHKIVCGAIQDFLNVHDRVTGLNKGGLSRRIVAQIKGWVLQHKKEALWLSRHDDRQGTPN